MDLGLKGRTALVCAASAGLGFGCAQALAGEGAQVILAARNRERLTEAAKRVGGRGIAADLDRPEDRERLAREAGEADILVTNNGGPKAGPSDAVSVEDYREAFESSCVAAIDLTTRLLPGMRARKWGRIIHIASISVKQPIAGLVLSNTGRTALVGYARTLAQEVARDGVRVHVVAPGSHDTDRIRELARDRASRKGTMPEAEMRAIEAEIPVGRLGRPEELGALVAFLASDRADFLTGTVIPVDGGAFRGMM